MAIRYTDDTKIFGYWFDANNGISNTYGFFEWLDRQSSIYTQEMGNPIDIWKMPIVDTSDYAGVGYEELDSLLLSRCYNKKIRSFYLQRFIYTQGNPSSRWDAVYNITRMYSKKWLALWETMFYEYNPIENYNMEEVLTDQVTEFEHGHIEELLNGRINTRTGDIKETPGVTITETTSIKGFDSDTFVGSDQNVTGQTGYNTTEYEQLKDTLSGTDKTTHSGTDTETKNYTLTRSGNIGVTTSQQMIEQERKLLMFDFFDRVVFPDIDKELTLQVY